MTIVTCYMLHVTCDLAGVHTPTEWLLHCEEVPVLLLTVVTTYATHQHQALLGKQRGQHSAESNQENNLGFLDRGEDYILPVLSRSCVCVDIFGAGMKGWMLEAAASMPSAVFSVQADRDKWLLFEAAVGTINYGE